MSKAAQLKSAAQLSWARSRRLAELADHEKSSDARSYLATLNGDSGVETLDTDADKRTATIRDLVTGFESWLAAGNKSTHGGPTGRRAEGDKNRAPRAGAPTKRKYTKRTGNRGDSLQADALFDIRAIQRKYDLTMAELLHLVEVLGRLVDEPIDLDQFIKEVKRRKAT